MREHGILRRALFAYTEAVLRLRGDTAPVDAGALHRAAMLFRTFGEDYHERALEEAHIFPVVRTLPGPAAVYPDVLTAQHERGREITDYILGATVHGMVGTADREPMARAMDALVRMYRAHAAHEDTRTSVVGNRLAFQSRRGGGVAGGGGLFTAWLPACDCRRDATGRPVTNR
ncbi:hypothetical protein FBZ90_1053 [Nitrospirillum pindoramense]|uniref:Hemerythrin-like domain-containing protein n=2 Tax=Nitrospirillum amazonense TaxID=28077 RepID=A0A560HCM6_9PROT|nr:hypothetical protein FBZ90_1053 [Nitrospirillum amazonense]